MESFFSMFGNFVVAIAPNEFELVVVAFLGQPSRLRNDPPFYFVSNVGTKDVFSAVFVVVVGRCLSSRPNMKLRKRKRKNVFALCFCTVQTQLAKPPLHCLQSVPRMTMDA